MSNTDDQLSAISAQLQTFLATLDNSVNWQVLFLAGSTNDPDSFDANGAKSGALGYYPVVNVSGQTVYMPCLARMKEIALGGANAETLAALVNSTQDKLAVVDQAVVDSNAARDLANAKATYAAQQGDFAKQQGLAIGDISQATVEVAANKVAAEQAASLVQAQVGQAGAQVSAEVVARKSIVRNAGRRFFAGLPIVQEIGDGSGRGAFLTNDNVFRVKLALLSAPNGVQITYDPTRGETTLAVPALDAEIAKRKALARTVPTRYFAGLPVVQEIGDGSGRGMFLTGDNVWRGKLALLAPSTGAVAISYDPTRGETTLDIPSIKKTLGPRYVLGKQIGIIGEDANKRVWWAGWLSGETYIAKAVFGSAQMIDGSPVGGSDFVETASAIFSVVTSNALQQIQRQDKATGAASIITSTGNNLSPSRSADGNSVIYKSDRDGSPVRYFQPIAGGAETRLISSPDLVMAGDSRTVFMLAQLDAALSGSGRAQDNQGVAGQTSAEIAPRLTGQSFQITFGASAIPASGSVAIASMSPNVLRGSSPSSRALHAIITVAGVPVPGVLSWSSAGGYTFTRDLAGSAITVSGAQAASCDGGVVTGTTSVAGVRSLVQLRQRTAIINPGYNDLQAGLFGNNFGFIYSRATLMNNIAAMVAALSPMVRRFLVGTVFGGEALLVNGSGGLAAGQSTLGAAPDAATSKTALDERLAINAAIAAAYPNNLLDYETALLPTYGETATVSGQAYSLLNSTALPDGIHVGTGAPMAAQINAILTTLSAKGF